MPKEYDNDMTGVLFRNEEKDDQHPNWADFKGSCEVGGVEHWISAWVKEFKKGRAKEGKKYFSLSFQPKESRGGGGSKSSKRDEPEPAKKSDDIPF